MNGVNMWGPTKVRAWALAIRGTYFIHIQHCGPAVQFGVGHHQYANDTHLYVALTPSDINTIVFPIYKTVLPPCTYMVQSERSGHKL